MRELTMTRHNPMIDPQLHIWGWEVAVYLFIGGLVAGLMMIAGWYLYTGRDRRSAMIVYHFPLLGIVLISLGMLALFLDLEHKFFFWRLYTTFKPKSPMSWGSWILLLVYPAMAVILLLGQRHYPHFLQQVNFIAHWSEKMRCSESVQRIIGLVNMLGGALLGVYTGALLSALAARPLWNSAVLWLLFAVSGLSTAAAYGHLVARDVAKREALARTDSILLGVESLVLAMFIINLLSSAAPYQEAAWLLLTGPFSPVFWVLVVGMGIIIPMVLQPLAVTHRIRHTAVPPLLVLTGGLILRFVIVAAGQYSRWM